jgi:hypothetical protein
LLAKIQQQGTAMKEANIFEAWADRLVEGTWQLPDTPEKQAQLLELMSTELPVGADATNVTEQLYDLLGDDELFDQLEALAERDANADARQVIYDRMQMLSNDPDVLKVIEQLQIDPTAEMNPPEATNPADLEPVQEGNDQVKSYVLERMKLIYQGALEGLDMTDDIASELGDYFTGVQRSGNPILKKAYAHVRDLADATPEEQATGTLEAIKLLQGNDNRLAEDSLRSIRRAAGLLTEEELKENVLKDDTGETIEHILNRFKHEVKKFKQGSELDNDLYHALFDYWNDLGEIPYGTQKARDGDPYIWVADNLESHLNGGGIVGGTDWSAEDDIERESVMHGDYAEEDREPHSVDGGMENPLIQGEGVAGAVLGGVAGAVLGGPAGAVRGAMAGDAIGDAISPDQTDENDASLFDDATCNMTEAGENCPVHGMEECWGSDDTSPLAGQYGHSGKMKAVSKDLSFLDRLKELSGLNK